MTTIESYHTDTVPICPPPPLQSTAMPASVFPVVTAVILIAMGVIFSAEVTFGVEPWSGAFEPSVTTLMAFGGLQYPLVADQGQWYRLLSAPLLHLDISHVLINGIVLWFSGRAVERMIGRSWFAAVFIIGAIAGGLMSLVVNAHNVVSVGASGAIMALLAARYALAFHYEPGSQRQAMQSNALRLLIPSLIPLGAGHASGAVDYGAHFGGAIAGVIMAAILLACWRRRDTTPSRARVAGAIVALGLFAASYSAAANAHEYRIYNLQRQLIPASDIPRDFAAIVARAPELFKQYPRDPRARFYQAVALVQAKDLAAAEAQIRIGLAEQDILRVLLVPTAKGHLQAYLALILTDEGRMNEARESARAGCLDSSESLQPALLEAGLCDAKVSSAR
ncbi:MAG TPA: rhomboid family intramembrane serine protease [Bradyrhizobium sp.]|nr:rhomboid family intramembrane serine protease [Bradyrhizobium sp.]